MKSVSIVVAVIFATALMPSVALSSELDLGALSYTVFGDGGISQPIAGFSNTPFLFLNATGNQTMSNMEAYGVTVPSNTTLGSILVSSAFTLTAAQSISVTINFLSNDAPIYDFGGAYLVSNGALVSTLYYVTPEPQVSASPGVIQTPDSITFQGDQITLGDVTYGPSRLCVVGDSGCDTGTTIGGSTDWVTSSYAPGAGTYQLLFAAFNTGEPIAPSGLAIQSVAVPEPDGLLLIFIGIGIPIWASLERCTSR